MTSNSSQGSLDDFVLTFDDLESSLYNLPREAAPKWLDERTLVEFDKEVLRARSAQRVTQLLKTLSSLLRLEQNWDGRGAEPPNKIAEDACALGLVLAVEYGACPSDVVASAEGGVAIRWDSGSKHAYIEFGNDGTAIRAFYDHVGEPVIAEFDPTLENTRSALAALERLLIA